LRFVAGFAAVGLEDVLDLGKDADIPRLKIRPRFHLRRPHSCPLSWTTLNLDDLTPLEMTALGVELERRGAKLRHLRLIRGAILRRQQEIAREIAEAAPAVARANAFEDAEQRGREQKAGKPNWQHKEEVIFSHAHRTPVSLQFLMISLIVPSVLVLFLDSGRSGGAFVSRRGQTE
jgi:hypothetical protein